MGDWIALTRARRLLGIRRLTAATIAGPAVALALATPARASTSHLVQPGETLSAIAAANGLSTASLAAWNGISAEGLLISGGSIIVPTTAEAGVETAGSGASATTSGGSGATHSVVAGESLGSIAAANGISVADLAATNGLSVTGTLLIGTSLTIPEATSSTAAAASPTPGLGAIPSPWGDLYLDATAAQAWNAMRQQSLTELGIDLYPAGPLSAYRTAEQQGELHDLFLSGIGAPANVPGASSHELGLSVDLASPEMRDAVDQLGWQYGWGKFEAPTEWWHVTYGG